MFQKETKIGQMKENSFNSYFEQNISPANILIVHLGNYPSETKGRLSPKSWGEAISIYMQGPWMVMLGEMGPIRSPCVTPPRPLAYEQASTAAT